MSSLKSIATEGFLTGSLKAVATYGFLSSALTFVEGWTGKMSFKLNVVTSIKTILGAK